MEKQKFRLLVADDSASLRQLLSHSLREQGYEVVAVGSGEEALAQASKHSFDLMILDVLMPGMTGLQVLEELRKKHSKLDLPVLIATSMSESSDVVHALELGANDYVTKPIDLPVALARVHAQLGLKAQASGVPASFSADGSMEPGAILDGRYKLASVIGEGAYAVVYKARQLSTNQTVAVKLLRAHRVARLGKAEVELARFKREMTLIGKLQHPHIVRLIDSGQLRVRNRTSSKPPVVGTSSSNDTLPKPESGGSSTGSSNEFAREARAATMPVETTIPYLVMEFLEGEPLVTMLRREGRLTIDQALEILLPVLTAVGAAHTQGVIHRDLKPHNIFLADTHEVWPKVLDFGVAKLAGDDASGLTSTSAVVGTPEYLSPEQARGAREIDERSDQYSLGTILYECVTGKRPIQGGSVLEYVYRIAAGAYEPPSAHVADLPEGFETVILRAMSSQPSTRFPSLKAFGRALLPFASPQVRQRWAREFGVNSDAPAAPATPPQGAGRP